MRKSKNLGVSNRIAPPTRRHPKVTITIDKRKLGPISPPLSAAPEKPKKGVKFEKETKRIEKVYYSRKHEGIVAKIVRGQGVAQVVNMEELNREPGQLFVQYMTRLIMEDVHGSSTNAKSK